MTGAQLLDFIEESIMIKKMAMFSIPFLVSACANVGSHNTSPPDIAPIHTVIDLVKDELNVYATSDRATSQAGHKCSGIVKIKPSKVTLTLKLSTNQKRDISGGLADPVGVIKLDPSIGTASEYANTTEISIPLDVVQDDSLKAQHVNKPGQHPIADAISNIRDELIKADHEKLPCLKVNKSDPIKVSVAFDVVKATGGGVELQLVVIKIGNKVTTTQEYHQKLDFELAADGDMFK